MQYYEAHFIAYTKHSFFSVGGGTISWDSPLWVNQNMTEKEVEFKDLCEPLNPGLVTLPERRPFRDSVDGCIKLGGTMAVPTSSTSARIIADKLAVSMGEK